MNKPVKTWIFRILVGIDAVLAVVLIPMVIGAAGEWAETYRAGVHHEANDWDSYFLMENLEDGYYGDAAVRARKVRIGEPVQQEDRKGLYLLGEYAELLYYERIYEAKGDLDAQKRCETRCEEIKNAIPDYAPILEKMDAGIHAWDEGVRKWKKQ